MAEAGVAVYQIERRGSGTDRAHERGHVDRAETWLADVAAAAELARQETGMPTVHLMGVSWGGKLALASAADRPDLYQGLILAAPGIIPRVGVALAAKIRIGQSLLVGSGLRRFPIPLSDPHLFTANPERLRYIAEDPLSLRDVTARFLFESRRLDAMARRAARAVRLPTLVLLAERDRIINNTATRTLVGAMATRLRQGEARLCRGEARRRVIVYPDASHTLEFEPEPEKYFRDLVAWLAEIEGAGKNTAECRR
jgi:alpha-beta hydrolase superfamily lysophospholipase